MTPYRFTQSVAIAKTKFPVGINEVSAEIEAHPDFLHFVKAGWIHEVDPSELVVKQPRAIATRGADLAKKLAEKHAPKAPKSVKPVQVQEPVRKPEEALSGDKSAEQVPEGVQDDELDDTVDEGDLTPQQKAARTRKANAEKAKTKEG